MVIKKEFPPRNKDEIIPSAERNLFVEILLTGLIALFISVFLMVIVNTLGYKEDPAYLVKITYSANKEFAYDSRFLNVSLILAGITFVAFFLVYNLIKPSGITPNYGRHLKYLLPMIVLGGFGYLAYVVIALFCASFHLDFGFSSFIASVCVGIYDYMIYKMYAERRTLSNSLFWEIFRFAIVGLVAAVFDFTICLLLQFVVFNGNDAIYVTAIATACGFIVGVIINYLMSTFMVYKASKSNFSKTPKGMLTFFILSAIGLGIGIGLQYLLYDFLCLNMGIEFLSYPLDFVIRTLVVMVYNYVTRKIFIYK